MPLFARRNRHAILGIDIGATSLKLVQLSRRGDHWVVDQCAISADDDLVIDGQIINPEYAGSAIKQLAKQHQITARKAVACVAYSDVLCKTVHTDYPLHAHELAEWVELEANKFVPFPIDELSVDFEVVDTAATGSGQTLAITACRQNRVDSIAQTIDSAGFEPLAIDVANHALLRVVDAAKDQGASPNTLAIIDLGATATRCYGYSGGSLVYHNESPMVGRDLVGRVMDNYGFSHQQAMTCFTSRHFPDDYQATILKPYLKQILADIERSLHAFDSLESSLGNGLGTAGHASQIVLVGGLARIHGLDQAVAKKTQREVKTLGDLTGMTLNKQLDRSAILQSAPQLALATGLAMWEQA